MVISVDAEREFYIFNIRIKILYNSHGKELLVLDKAGL